MKSLTFLLILAAFFLVSFGLVSEKKPSPPDPLKKYTVSITLTLPDWTAVLNSIATSDQVTARTSNDIRTTIITQLQPLIAQATKEDSINQARQKIKKP